MVAEGEVGERGKLCERTHHDSGTLFVRSFFISRGESLLRFIIRPAFHAAESSLRLDFIVEKRETRNNAIVVCCVRTKKAGKSLFSGAPIEELHFIFFNFK